MGVRVRDIESDTLRNIRAFGPDKAFFEEDRILLLDWCQGIIIMHNKYEKRRWAEDYQIKSVTKGLNLRRKKEVYEEDIIIEGLCYYQHNSFKELADLCRKIYIKLDIEKYKDMCKIQDFEKSQFELLEIEKRKVAIRI